MSGILYVLNKLFIMYFNILHNYYDNHHWMDVLGARWSQKDVMGAHRLIQFLLDCKLQLLDQLLAHCCKHYIYRLMESCLNLE